MLIFPGCKINLGLQVSHKRPDGYHHIETVFYPVSWCDVLEVIESKSDENQFLLTFGGMDIQGTMENNLVYKAWQLVAGQRKIPPLKANLYKNIPMGAGLGGGSADAAFFINLLNQQLSLGFTMEERINMASQLGSDCAFFIRNEPVLASGKGDEFSGIKVDLSAYQILVVYPGIHSDTKAAYQNLVPQKPGYNLKETLEGSPIETWKNVLVNDFEAPIFKKHPSIKTLKENLYSKGALYASMSGSGSAVFGIFGNEPEIDFPAGYIYFLQKPKRKIL